MSNPEIHFIRHQNIDFKKWDRCIDNSGFGTVYAKSWYLNRICRHWDALVDGDYLAVMPLPNNRKYGLWYIFQPFFTQQLGVFSPVPLTPETVNLFFNAIPVKFSLTDTNLNLGNQIKSAEFNVRANTTYHLELGQDHGEIRNKYKTNTLRNIQKAVQHHIHISQVSDISQFMRFSSGNLQSKSPEIKPVHYAALEAVITYALANQSGEILGAYDSENNLLASVFFVRSNQTVIYLAASSNQSGIEKSAMFLLIDTFIGQNAGKNLILDFEGSNIPGVARFYAGFGAKPQTYYSIHQNRLPKLLRIFKK